MLLMTGADIAPDVREEEEAAAATGWSGTARLRRTRGRTSSRTSTTSRTTAAVASPPTCRWQGRTRHDGRLCAGRWAGGDFRVFFIFRFFVPSERYNLTTRDNRLSHVVFLTRLHGKMIILCGWAAARENIEFFLEPWVQSGKSSARKHHFDRTEK